MTISLMNGLIASSWQIVKEHKTAIITIAVVEVAINAIKYLTTDPHLVYSPNFKEEKAKAFDGAYKRYIDDHKLHEYDSIEYKAAKYEEAKEGICHGLVVAFFNSIQNNSNSSLHDLAKKVNFEEGILNQFNYGDILYRASIFEARFNDRFNEINARDIPWQEKPNYYFKNVTESEEKWVKAVSYTLSDYSDFIARVSFDVCSTSSHTFAFWQKEDFGLFDNGFVYRYNNQIDLIKAVRNLALRYRDQPKVSAEEKKEYQLKPIGLFFKENDLVKTLQI